MSKNIFMLRKGQKGKNMKNIAKILCFVLSLVLVFSVIGVSTFAEGETVTTVLPEGAVFPEGMTVTDGTNYYATMKAALEGIHLTENRTLWCKPGADVGVMTHGHVCDDLTVYGNGAKLTASGEQDFEVDQYNFCHNGANACSGLTGDMTLKVVSLDGCGAWGTRDSAYTVNFIFENCKDMNRIYINGTAGVNNITLTNCSFLGSVNKECTLYSNANGNVVVTDCDFSNIYVPINLNHKVAGVQNVVISDCSFDACGAEKYDYAAPIRVLSSVEGSKTVLTVSECSFTNTVANKQGQNADILLDYAIGKTNVSISSTAGNVVTEAEENVGTTETITATDTYTNVVAKIGDVTYCDFADAIDAAVDGDVIELVNDVTADVTIVRAADVDIVVDGKGNTFNGTITVDGKSATYATGSLTIKNVNFDATGITKDASINLGGTNTTRYITNLTVENCTFTGTDNVKVAIKSYTGGDKNLTVVGCTATGMHSLAQLKNVAGVTVSDCDVTGKSGIALGASSGVAISNCDMELTDYGVRMDANAALDDVSTTISDCNIEAYIPVVVRKATVEYGLVFSGENTMTATNDDGLWCAIGVEEYGDVVEGVEITAENLTAPSVDVWVTIEDEGLDAGGVSMDYVAYIGNVYYVSLQDAINAGGEIVLLCDVELTEKLVVPADKTIVLDLNGHVVSGVSSEAKASAVIENKGTLTIKSSVDGGKITSKALTPDTEWGGEGQIAYPSYANNTIANKGTLVLESGIIENTSAAGGATYAIDNYAGTITVNGGKVYCENNFAIRLFANNIAMGITVNGGEIIGTRAIWIQLPSNNASIAPEVDVTITNGVLTATKIDSSDNQLAIYSYNYGNDPKNVNINISGGTFNGDIAVTGGKNKTNIENINISGGTFNGRWGEVYSYGDDALAAEAITITGGTFATDAAKIYCGDDGFRFVAVYDADGNVVSYGVSAASATPEINEDGNWVIGGVDTGLIAEPKITINENGFWVINGVKTSVSAIGEDGVSPVIEVRVNANGKTHWFINGKDTGVKAQGVDGVSIDRVEYHTSVDNQDIYYIYFTDGSKTTFTVTNGRPGEQGPQGPQGIEGPKGDKGEQGDPGADGNDNNKTVVISVAIATVCTILALSVVLYRGVGRRSWWCTK